MVFICSVDRETVFNKLCIFCLIAMVITVIIVELVCDSSAVLVIDKHTTSILCICLCTDRIQMVFLGVHFCAY